MRLRLLLGVGVMSLGLVAPALAATPVRSWVLNYQGTNKWVAEADNKPLRSILKAAREGETHFEVRLPAAGRDLSVSRLEVLRDLMAREAKESVLLEEIDGDVRSGTIWVGVK